MPDRLRLAVFDCDGTLVDSQHAIVSAMTRACVACDVPAPPAEVIRRTVGLPLPEAVARMVPDVVGLRHERLVQGFRDAFRESHGEPGDMEPLYPGVHAAIAALEEAGFLLAIATGKSRRGLIATLERHGLREHFVCLKTVDDGPGKPSPVILRDAMVEMGVEAAETVMIGDTTFDMMMAGAAGAKAIGVAWGYHDVHELVAYGAHEIVSSYGPLPATVARLIEPVEPVPGCPGPADVMV